MVSYAAGMLIIANMPRRCYLANTGESTSFVQFQCCSVEIIAVTEPICGMFDVGVERAAQARLAAKTLALRHQSL